MCRFRLAGYTAHQDVALINTNNNPAHADKGGQDTAGELYLPVALKQEPRRISSSLMMASEREQTNNSPRQEFLWDGRRGLELSGLPQLTQAQDSIVPRCETLQLSQRWQPHETQHGLKDMPRTVGPSKIMSNSCQLRTPRQ